MNDVSSNVKLKLSAPWVTYVNKVKALFEKDPEIEITFLNSNWSPRLIIKTDNSNKAAALGIVFPNEKIFGNITLFIDIIGDIESAAFECDQDIITALFDGNPVFAFSELVHDIFGGSILYVVFKNEVVQFFNDNLNDIYGNISTLYQNIAKEIFEDTGAFFGVFYCTDVKVPNKREWP